MSTEPGFVDKSVNVLNKVGAFIKGSVKFIRFLIGLVLVPVSVVLCAWLLGLPALADKRLIDLTVGDVLWGIFGVFACVAVFKIVCMSYFDSIK